MKSMCGLWEMWTCSLQRYASWSTQLVSCWCPPEPCPPRRPEPCCKPGMLEWICLAEPDEAQTALEMWRGAENPRLKMFIPEGGNDPVAKAEFKRVENVMVLFLTVSKEAAGGTYRGVILDAHGESCGELSLLVPKQAEVKV